MIIQPTRTIALLLGLALMADTGAAQLAPSVVVTVSARGAGVALADVCMLDSNGATIAATRADGQGRASLPLPDGFAPPLPSMGRGPAYSIVASESGRGAQQAVTGPGPMGIGLPPTGGPLCDPQQVPQSRLSVTRSQVDAALARQSANPVGTRVGPISRIRETCFGAAGMRCMDRVDQLGTCDPLTHTCQINRGSWEHDECCISNPNGGMCNLFGDGGYQPGAVCQANFDTALARLPTVFTWRRTVDFNDVNTTGIVDHAKYCALGGAFMPAGEDRFCCSRQTRAPTKVERATAAATPTPIVMVATMRVCTAPSS